MMSLTSLLRGDIMDNIKSILNMNKLVFDKIEFDRQGFKNQNQPCYSIETHFARNQHENIYRVTLILKCDKRDEYTFEISLTGYFSFDSQDEMDEDEKNELISKNAVAIIMPYMRSQVSLLTAQPDVDCVVLPPFNINNMLKEDKLTEDK